MSTASSSSSNSTTRSTSSSIQCSDIASEEEVSSRLSKDKVAPQENIQHRDKKKIFHRKLSTCSSKYDKEHKGYLNKYEQLARSLDSKNRGSIDPETVVQLLQEQDALQKRQWLYFWGILSNGSQSLLEQCSHSSSLPSGNINKMSVERS